MERYAAFRERVSGGTANENLETRTKRLRCAMLCLAAVIAVVSTAYAQAPSSAGTDEGAEAYHAEIAVGVWNAFPDVVISSGTLGIEGSDIDFVGDFGLIRKRLPQLRVALKPASRHKIRIGYVPTSFEAKRTLRRTLSFGSTSFDIGIPVSASLTFRTWRFGYEYDLISSARGFVGVIGDVGYTRVGANLSSGFLGVSSSLTDALIPAVGGIGRGYLHRRVAVTGEVTWFQIPELIDGLGDGGRSVDFDVSGLVTFTRTVGIQAGYRTLDVNYRRDDDAGSVGLRGLYISSIIRF
jgi:hypothetical protein